MSALETGLTVLLTVTWVLLIVGTVVAVVAMIH